MNGIDVALVVLLLLAALRGSWRGFFRESLGFIALVGGLGAALRGAEPAAAWIGSIVPSGEFSGSALLGAAFVAVFLVVSTLLGLIGVACDQLFGRGRLQTISRVGGALFEPAKSAVVLAFVLLFFHLFPLAPVVEQQIAGSRLAPPMVSAAGAVLRAGWRDGAAANRPV